jgi:hypothetical protein
MPWNFSAEQRGPWIAVRFSRLLLVFILVRFCVISAKRKIYENLFMWTQICITEHVESVFMCVYYCEIYRRNDVERERDLFHF